MKLAKISLGDAASAISAKRTYPSMSIARLRPLADIPHPRPPQRLFSSKRLWKSALALIIGVIAGQYVDAVGRHEVQREHPPDIYGGRPGLFHANDDSAGSCSSNSASQASDISIITKRSAVGKTVKM